MKKRRKKTSRARFGQGACPCHSGAPYAACCRPYHKEEALPGSPEQLMRSRYAAYATSRVEYIIATTDPEGPQYEVDLDGWRASIASFCASTTFVGLTIEETSAREDEGEVRFIAQMLQDGERVAMREHSTFRRLRDGDDEKAPGRWVYVGAR